MRKWIQRFFARQMLWLLRGSQIAQFGDISVCDLSKGEPEFKTVMLAALQLLKDTDLRRFARVNRHLKWISNIALSRGGAQYRHDLQACMIDFVKPETDAQFPYYVAWYASVLVHEATHGVLRTRSILYSRELRTRIKHLCVTEQNRFAHRLESTQPKVAKYVHQEFDEADWHVSWNRKPAPDFLALLRRLFTGRHK